MELLDLATSVTTAAHPAWDAGNQLVVERPPVRAHPEVTAPSAGHGLLWHSLRDAHTDWRVTLNHGLISASPGGVVITTSLQLNTHLP